MKKLWCVLLIGVITVLSACNVAAVSSQPQNTSSAASSKTESVPSSNVVSSIPSVSSQPASSVNSPSSTMEDWEASYNPAKDWKFNNYKNVDVNADVSVLESKVIAQITSARSTTYLRTTDGEVYSIGSNQYKQLGQNTFQYLYGLQKVELPEPIKLICGGTTGALAVGESNTLYLWGRVTDWPYLNENDEEIINTYGSDIITIPFDQEVVQVSFQLGKITLLTTDGTAYAFGEAYEAGYLSESKGIDGYHWKIENLLVPQKIILPEKIVKAEATEHAMFWLGESGAVYTAYDKPIIDFPCEAIEENPYARKLSFDQKVTNITVGLANLFMQTQSGDVYAVGANWPIVVPGITEQESNRFSDYYYWVLSKPIKLTTDFRIKKIFGGVGRAAMFFQAEDGAVYVIGEDLGNELLTKQEGEEDNPTKFVYHEELVRMNIPKVSDFFARGNTYYFRDAADGKIYTAGYNMYGTAIGAQRSFDGEIRVQRTPVEVPLQFTEDFQLSE